MRIRKRLGGLSTVGFLASTGALVACAAADDARQDPPRFDDEPQDPVIGTGGSSGSFPSTGGTVGGGGGISIDLGPVVTLERPPPAVSGGTLLALRSGDEVVVADPDRDRIQLASLGRDTVMWTAAFEVGAEPGRLIEDAAGTIHAVLRGSGEVASLDPVLGKVRERRGVCEAPRGLVYDEVNDSLVVACLEGLLVELPAAGGEATRVTEIAPDLRDVVFQGQKLFATRFRSAEILELDAERNVVARRTPVPQDPGFSSAVAWRAVPAPDGSIAVVHQLGIDQPVDIGDGHTDGGVGGEGSDGVGGGFAGKGGETGSGQGYGESGQPCGAIVKSVVTRLDPVGSVTTSLPLGLVTLPVDVAVSADGRTAVANAAFSPFTGGSTVGVFGAEVMLTAEACSFPMVFPSIGQGAVVAVAFEPTTDDLLAQTREPATLSVYDRNGILLNEIALGGASMLDTGHQTFHVDSGAGIACASCHPEGTDDGRVWNFLGHGPRRTQPLDVGLAGTAPFHWAGDMEDFGMLVSEVFERRMRGPILDLARAQALERFVYGIPRRPAIRAADEPEVERGRALFESDAVGCTACHSGVNYSTGRTVTVGREVALQVPSLIGVGLRAPYMHDGCAATLHDRFDEACGGSEHGQVSQLSELELDDLVAFLESL